VLTADLIKVPLGKDGNREKENEGEPTPGERRSWPGGQGEETVKNEKGRDGEEGGV